MGMYANLEAARDTLQKLHDCCADTADVSPREMFIKPKARTAVNIVNQLLADIGMEELTGKIDAVELLSEA